MSKLSAEYRFVKPIKGLLVRYPYIKTILPEAGEVVAWVGADGTYWRRRARDGSIEVYTEDLRKIIKPEVKPIVQEVKKINKKSNKQGGIENGNIV